MESLPDNSVVVVPTTEQHDSRVDIRPDICAVLVPNTSIIDLNVTVVVPTTEQQLSRLEIRPDNSVVVVPTTEQHDSRMDILPDI